MADALLGLRRVWLRLRVVLGVEWREQGRVDGRRHVVVLQQLQVGLGSGMSVDVSPAVGARRRVKAESRSALCNHAERQLAHARPDTRHSKLKQRGVAGGGYCGMAHSSEPGSCRAEARAFPQPSFSFNIKHTQHGAEHTQADEATQT